MSKFLRQLKYKIYHHGLYANNTFEDGVRKTIREFKGGFNLLAINAFINDLEKARASEQQEATKRAVLNIAKKFKSDFLRKGDDDLQRIVIA